ncbi:MAG: LysE family transporter [Candidatus Paracaedimonas acanthamoebae]|mgnify:CR=1 FL=1|uniref:LysE family transporter n=1 Tax=Candidatus Paracaedimonas acanthamoebae TaxID=244581 RepID=A0A8J7PK65_9PROT|nr:LysE family transporter [Candidatus Paracaedimonas acanthamoebae]
MKDLFLTYLPSILSVTAMQIIGLVSPGPDFAIVVRNSLIHSRSLALLTAFGIAGGIMLHVTYILMGLGAFIAQTEWLLVMLKVLGAGYLSYLGIRGLRASATSKNISQKPIELKLTPFGALRSGFLTNALNPKAMLFILSLLSLNVSDQTPKAILGYYASMIFITTLVWFTIVAFCFSNERARLFFSQYRHWIDRITGGFLLLMALKLLLG